MAQEASRDSSPTADVRMSPGMASYGPHGGSFVRLPEPHPTQRQRVLWTTPRLTKPNHQILNIKADRSIKMVVEGVSTLMFSF